MKLQIKVGDPKNSRLCPCELIGYCF